MSSRKPSTTEAWNNSVDDMVDMADENLAALEKAKASSKPSPSYRFPLPEYVSGSSNSSSKSEHKRDHLRDDGLSRSSGAGAGTGSAPRYTFPPQDRAVGEHKESGDIKNNGSIAIDRKLDIMFKKQKLNEDRLSSIEQKVSTLLQQQHGSNKNDKSSSHSRGGDSSHVRLETLEKQLSILGGKIDSLSAIQKIDAKASRNTFAADLPHNIQEIVGNCVQNELRGAMDLIIDTCLKEQNKNFVKHSERVAAENKLYNKSSQRSIEMLENFEREVTKLKKETERVVARQQHVDDIYKTLKNGVAEREKITEQSNKKALSTYRFEFDSLMSKYDKKLAGLAALPIDASDLSTLRVDFEAFVQKTDYTLETVNSSVLNLKEFQQQVSEDLRTTIEQTRDTASRLYDAENATQAVIENLKFCEDLAEIVEEQRITTEEHTKVLRDMETKVANMADSLDNLSHSEPLALLARSIDDVNNKFEARTDTLKAQLDSHQESLAGSAQLMSEISRRTLEQARELAGSVNDSAKTREAVEAVLNEIDGRTLEDSAWIYDLKTAQQRLDLKLSLLESQNADQGKFIKATSKAQTDKMEAAIEALSENMQRIESEFMQREESAEKRHSEEDKHLLEYLNTALQAKKAELSSEIISTVAKRTVEAEARLGEALQGGNAEYAEALQRVQQAVLEVQRVQYQNQSAVESLEKMVLPNIDDLNNSTEQSEKLMLAMDSAVTGLHNKLQRCEEVLTDLVEGKLKTVVAHGSHVDLQLGNVEGLMFVLESRVADIERRQQQKAAEEQHDKRMASPAHNRGRGQPMMQQQERQQPSVLLSQLKVAEQVWQENNNKNAKSNNNINYNNNNGDSSSSSISPNRRSTGTSMSTDDAAPTSASISASSPLGGGNKATEALASTIRMPKTIDALLATASTSPPPAAPVAPTPVGDTSMYIQDGGFKPYGSQPLTSAAAAAAAISTRPDRSMSSSYFPSSDSVISDDLNSTALGLRSHYDSPPSKQHQLGGDPSSINMLSPMSSYGGTGTMSTRETPSKKQQQQPAAVPITEWMHEQQQRRVQSEQKLREQHSPHKTLLSPANHNNNNNNNNNNASLLLGAGAGAGAGAAAYYSPSSTGDSADKVHPTAPRSADKAVGPDYPSSSSSSAAVAESGASNEDDDDDDKDDEVKAAKHAADMSEFNLMIDEANVNIHALDIHLISSQGSEKGKKIKNTSGNSHGGKVAAAAAAGTHPQLTDPRGGDSNTSSSNNSEEEEDETGYKGESNNAQQALHALLQKKNAHRRQYQRDLQNY